VLCCDETRLSQVPALGATRFEDSQNDYRVGVFQRPHPSRVHLENLAKAPDLQDDVEGDDPGAVIATARVMVWNPGSSKRI
jgi:hypothetical protein